MKLPIIPMTPLGLMIKSDPIVYIVDDDPLARESMTALAASMGLGCETFPSGEQFLERFDPERVACVVIDLRLEAMDGLQLQERLLDTGCVLPVILIGGDVNVPAAVQALRNGAVTVLEKPCQPDRLVDAIRTAMNLCRERQNAVRKKMAVQARFESLDARQREAMSMILRGMPNKNIAGKLGISQRTMNRLRAEIFAKMGADSAVMLAQIALPLQNSATIMRWDFESPPRPARRGNRAAISN